MSMQPGQRFDLHNLIIEKVTFYDRKIHNEEWRTIWRYAFRSVLTHDKFVYSGKFMGFQVGDIVSIRGTVKRSIDSYGFVRLSRILKIPTSTQEELGL